MLEGDVGEARPFGAFRPNFVPISLRRSVRPLSVLPTAAAGKTADDDATKGSGKGGREEHFLLPETGEQARMTYEGNKMPHKK